MTYQVQIKRGGKYRPCRIDPNHQTLEAAIASCCRRDEDGIFPSDVRIVNDVSKVIVTHRIWLKLRSSASASAPAE